MSEQKNLTREEMRTLLGSEDEQFTEMLIQLGWEDWQEFPLDQQLTLQRYASLKSTYTKEQLETEQSSKGMNLYDFIHRFYQENQATIVDKSKNDKRKKPSKRYGGKGIRKEIQETLGSENPFNLTSFSELLELCNLGDEDSYTEEEKESLFKALPRYLLSKQKQSLEPFSLEEGELSQLLEQQGEKIAEVIVNTIVQETVREEQKYKLLVEKVIPVMVMNQFKQKYDEGYLAEKIEKERQRYAESQQGGTIEVMVNQEIKGNLPSAAADE
jgi:hypothetical protein